MPQGRPLRNLVTFINKRTRSSRFWVAVSGSTVAIVSAVIIIGVWWQNWKLGLPSSADKITRINTVVATSAYALVFLAALFALVAYWQASGRPSIVNIHVPGARDFAGRDGVAGAGGVYGGSGMGGIQGRPARASWMAVRTWAPCLATVEM